MSEQSHLHALNVASCVSRSLASLLLLLSNSHVHTAALRSQAQAVASFEGLQQKLLVLVLGLLLQGILNLV